MRFDDGAVEGFAGKRRDGSVRSDGPGFNIGDAPLCSVIRNFDVGPVLALFGKDLQSQIHEPMVCQIIRSFLVIKNDRVAGMRGVGRHLQFFWIKGLPIIEGQEPSRSRKERKCQKERRKFGARHHSTLTKHKSMGKMPAGYTTFNRWLQDASESVPIVTRCVIR